MTKAKEASIPQKHLHSRISYLFQAAAYLTTVQQVPAYRKSETLLSNSLDNNPSQAIVIEDNPTPNAEGVLDSPELCLSEQAPLIGSQPSVESKGLGLPFHLVDNLQSVSRKGQIRLSPTIKQSICKNCRAFLISGSTMSVYVENKSQGGRKSWADVLVRTCHYCGTSRRFPIGAQRQSRKQDRKGESSNSKASHQTPQL